MSLHALTKVVLELLERRDERLGGETAAVLTEPAETDGLGTGWFEAHGRAASRNFGGSSRHPADCTGPGVAIRSSSET